MLTDSSSYYRESRVQSRKLKYRFGARNLFQEPSLKLSSRTVHRLVGRYDNPMPTCFLAPIAGLKLPILIQTSIRDPNPDPDPNPDQDPRKVYFATRSKSGIPPF